VPNKIPLNEVLSMQKTNMSHDQIVDELHQKGYTFQQIMDAINQAELKTTPKDAGYQDDSLQLMDTNQSLPNQEFPDIVTPTPGMSYEQTQFQTQFQPQLQPQFQQPQRNIEEQIEEIAEAIVDEKWEDLTKDVGNMNVWKEGLQTEVESVKQEVLRLEGRLEKLQQAILRKVDDYNRTLSEVNTEMQALGKVFEKIIQPLTTNIKDLSRITAELKKKK